MLKRILQSALIDFMTILNPKMIVLFAFLFYVFANADLGAAFFIVPFVFAFHPFHVEEQGASALQYAPLKRLDIVRGRYLYSLLLLVLVVPSSLLLLLLLSLIFSTGGGSLFGLYEMGLMLILHLTFLAILLPFFFRCGYRWSQAGIYLVVLLFALLSTFHGSIPGFDPLLNTLSGTLDGPLFLLPLLAAGLAYWGSCRLSARFYSSRNL